MIFIYQHLTAISLAITH